MIGIHIYDSRLDYSDNHLNITKKIGKLKITLSYHRDYDREVVFEDNEYVVFVDGWIFNLNYKTQASETLKLYKRYLDDLPYYLNGQFNIVIGNKNNEEYIFLNDIYGFRKHFLSNNIISSDYQFVLNNTENYSINKTNISYSIENMKLIQRDKTFINEINLVKNASIIKNFNQENYDLEKIESNYKKDFNVNEFVELLIAKKNQIHKHNILLPLSGGIDSRFMLELLRDKVSFTLSYGDILSDELKVANFVAKSNNTQHIEIDLKPEDFIKDSFRYIKEYGGLDIFTQSSVYKVMKESKRQINESLVIDTGFALDVFLGDTYGEYLTKEFLYERVFFVLALRQSAFREYFEDIYFMYDYEIYFFMKNLNKKRKKYGFYYNLLKHIVKNSFNIPIQSTMIDLSLEPKYWKNAEKIQKEKEYFVLEHYKLHKKAIYHHRYYSDFDMWIRDNKGWKNLIDKLFFEDKPLILEFLNIDKLRDIILSHYNGETHLRKIVKWITIEMYLRGLK